MPRRRVGERRPPAGLEIGRVLAGVRGRLALAWSSTAAPSCPRSIATAHCTDAGIARGFLPRRRTADATARPRRPHPSAARRRPPTPRTAAPAPSATPRASSSACRGRRRPPRRRRTRAASRPAVVNQSSEVTRESDPGGISRPSVVSHSVKPALTPIPASSSKPAIAAVEPAKPMMIGWQAAARKQIVQTSIGRSARRRSARIAPRIVPIAEAGRRSRPSCRRRRARGRRSPGRARARTAARSGGRRSARA